MNIKTLYKFKILQNLAANTLLEAVKNIKINTDLPKVVSSYSLRESIDFSKY